MRAHFNTTETRSNFVRRLFIVCLAFAAISTSSFSTVTHAEDIPGGGGTPVTIEYFSVLPSGGNSWVADGVIQAENMADVSIEFSGAADVITKPDAYGYFSLLLSAAPGTVLKIDATDSMGTDHDQKVLNPFVL